MEQIMCGMLAHSKAGHDAKTLYLVCRTEGDFVYLCDGRLRKFDSPKKKNKKHIQIIHKIPEALANWNGEALSCLLYTSPSPRDRQKSRMPSSA